MHLRQVELSLLGVFFRVSGVIDHEAAFRTMATPTADAWLDSLFANNSDHLP